MTVNLLTGKISQKQEVEAFSQIDFSHLQANSDDIRKENIVMKRKLIAFTIVFAIAVGLCMAGCAPAVSVQWNMHATLLMTDGTAEDSFSLPVVGVISEMEDRHYLKLEVNLPKSVPYMMSVSEPNGDPVERDILDREGDYVTWGYCYDVKDNAPTPVMWGINIENRYFIAYWGADYGKFLVASVDPSVKPAEIMEHFDYLVERMEQTRNTK